MIPRSGRWSALILLALAPLVAASPQDVATPPARTKLDLTPFASGFQNASGHRPELQPILAGDKVLVTSTLRLFAFAAGTGDLAWSAGPVEGWEAVATTRDPELFLGIDFDEVWVAPAAGEHVALAALQLPFSKTKDDAWQGIQITKALPERRLFAFDLATGRALWNHAPAAGWDGASGSFAERMSVIGPPLVAGECVLVPCASDAAKVDYHVACYALATGALLWSTPVVEGQVERNMFGRAAREFAAAPLALAKGTPELVVVQTGLGVVAALELATGKVSWRAEYESLPLPKTHRYNTPVRKRIWRTSPPVVAGDVVFATPADGVELLALDLADGHRLWSLDAKTLDPHDEHAFDHLIGVHDQVLYFGGSRVAAFTKRQGLRSPGVPEPSWTARLPEVQGRCVRAQLAGDVLLAPGEKECARFERESGRALAPLPVADALGLLALDEALFALTRDGFLRLPR